MLIACFHILLHIPLICVLDSLHILILFPHRHVLRLSLYNIPVSRIPLPIMPSSLQGMLQIFSLPLCFLFSALYLQGCMPVLTVPENAHGLFLSLFLKILSHIVSLSQGIFLSTSYLHLLLLPLFYILLDILYDTQIFFEVRILR